MVTSVKFYSGKDINLRRAMPFSVAVVFLLVLLLKPSGLLGKSNE